MVCAQEPVTPFFGYLGFDNFPMALLTIFSTVTLSDWDKTMHYTMDGMSEPETRHRCCCCNLDLLGIIHTLQV